MRSSVRFATYGIILNLGARLIFSLGALYSSTTNNAEVGFTHSDEDQLIWGCVWPDLGTWEVSPGILYVIYAFQENMNLNMQRSKFPALDTNYVRTAWHDGRTAESGNILIGIRIYTYMS